MPIYPRQTKTKGLVYDVVVYGGPKPVWRRGFAKQGPLKEAGTAMYEEARIKNELRLGRQPPSERLMLADFLKNTWLPSKEQGNQKTYVLHRQMIDRVTVFRLNNARKDLGDTPLSRLVGVEIDAWRQSLVREGLAANTVRGYLLRLKTALQYARDLGLLHENPAQGVKVPAAEKRVPWILSVDEVRELLAMTAPTSYGPLVALALFTTKRWDELTHLTWRDIDFERRIAYIGRAKNPTSRNAVPLTSAAIVELDLQKLRVKELRRKAGDAWENLDLVFCGRRGQLLKENSFHYVWTRLVGRRWDDLHFHDLRHQSITMMGWAGVPLKAAAELAGHSSTKSTGEIYSHVTEENRRAAAEALESLIKGSA